MEPGYLIAISRKLDDPLSGLIVSRSAAGKSSLLNSVLDFVPPEDKQLVTSLTTQALYYLPSDGLRHKILAMAEDEGSRSSSYPLKILQSEKRLTLAVTVRDPDGGLPQTRIKTVEGPVALFMTSTRAEFDEEVANRFLILSVDEDRTQTKRIHEAQRQAETLRGLMAKMDRDVILATHHNAQRLLKHVRVINPLVDTLAFPDDRLRLRRDHKKYLGLIRGITFLRQYQKAARSCEHRGKTILYVEVDAEDIRLADEFAGSVLGQSLDDLSPTTRAFLVALHAQANAWEGERMLPRDKLRFTRREIRERLKWSEPQIRRQLNRLQELEFVSCHRIPGSSVQYHYQLLWTGRETEPTPLTAATA